jgi:hypothetical protein
MKVYVNSESKNIIAVSSDTQDLSKFYNNCFVISVEKIEDKVVNRKIWSELRDKFGNIIWEKDVKTGNLSPKRGFIFIKTKVSFTSQPYSWSLNEILNKN